MPPGLSDDELAHLWEHRTKSITVLAEEMRRAKSTVMVNLRGLYLAIEGEEAWLERLAQQRSAGATKSGAQKREAARLAPRPPKARPPKKRCTEGLPREVERTCSTHGDTTFILETRGSYRCKKCRSAAVIRRRRLVIQMLKAEHGGRCFHCGFDAFTEALDFHHLDPDEKEFSVGMGITYSLERIRAESMKCVLLCSNCHRGVENDRVTLDENRLAEYYAQVATRQAKARSR